MKVKIAVFILVIIGAAMPVGATQTAVIPAYAFVSLFQSSIREYQTLMDNHNRAAARKLLRSEKVFLSPKDVKVEVVTVDDTIAKVKVDRLDENAKPITLYFWTLAEQLQWLPRE